MSQQAHTSDVLGGKPCSFSSSSVSQIFEPISRVPELLCIKNPNVRKKTRVTEVLPEPNENTQTMEKGPFSFFWLPAEIRRLVYQRLLRAPRDIINKRSKDLFYRANPVYPAILRTCHIIHDEAVQILYGDNTFRFEVSVDSPWHVQVFGNTSADWTFEGHRNVWMFKRLQLLIPIPDFLLRPIATTSFLPQLARVSRRREGLEVAFNKTWRMDEVDSLNFGQSFLTNAVFQSLKQMSNFEKVAILLPTRYSGEIVWAPSLSRELESVLGPNLSEVKTWLEFKPWDKPRNWERDNVSPLMRLPAHVRRTIILYVIGCDSIVYPTKNSADHTHKGTWRVIPNIRRANPNRDLSLLHTCQKLWEESWRVILGHNYVVLRVDSTDPLYSHGTLPDQFLSHVRNVKFEIGDIASSSEWETQCVSLQFALQRDFGSLAKHIIWDASISRGNLIIELDLLEPNWTMSSSREGFREIQKEMGHMEHDYYTLPNGYALGYINGIYGRDLWFGYHLRYMKVWKFVHINLSPLTLHYGHWRRGVTKYIEEELGPNLSHIEGRLTFRPRYFQNMCRLTNVSHKEIFEFMRRRKHLSDNVEFDLNEDEAGRDEEDPYRDIWDEPLDTSSTFEEVEEAAYDGVGERTEAAIQAMDNHELAQALVTTNAAEPESEPSDPYGPEPELGNQPHRALLPTSQWDSEYEEESDEGSLSGPARTNPIGSEAEAEGALRDVGEVGRYRVVRR
ncbi:hypothetical protein MMC30_005101 [Trapelia coarctata]|nr:hypothetical protein [Trapelia coarctata]